MFEFNNKHSFIGKINRAQEADNKGWGWAGKAFAAKTEEAARKATRNSNRYYNLVKGGKKTAGGFPMTVI